MWCQAIRSLSKMDALSLFWAMDAKVMQMKHPMTSFTLEDPLRIFQKDSWHKSSPMERYTSPLPMWVKTAISTCSRSRKQCPDKNTEICIFGPRTLHLWLILTDNWEMTGRDTRYFRACEQFRYNIGESTKIQHLKLKRQKPKDPKHTNIPNVPMKRNMAEVKLHCGLKDVTGLIHIDSNWTDMSVVLRFKIIRTKYNTISAISFNKSNLCLMAIRIIIASLQQRHNLLV
uniref:Uncharacterized protein n=2 Tax=Cacopsylla melanoneura TaxID=428564 RepID=A0A8D8RTA8_9HEMI